MKKEVNTRNTMQKTQASASVNKPGSTAAAGEKCAAAPSRPMLKQDDLSSLKEAASTVHQIMLNAQRELEAARRMRDDARKYQQETATRARSDAQQLMLKTRLATQREAEEMIRQSSEEIQKVLADIRMIRIMAQEELAAQRKFTDAARLQTMSMALQGEGEKSEGQEQNPLISLL